MRSRPTRRLIAVTALAALLTAVPIGVLASHQFADVPDSSSYHGDIAAIADAGVTTGCGGGNYCPKAYVTREQMAAFMNRLGALGAGKTPVVNADKLDGKDSSGFLQSTDIVQILSGPWLYPFGWEGSSTQQVYSDGVVLKRASAGDSTVMLSIPSPTSVGGAVYGFKKVEVCFDGGSTNAQVRVLGVVRFGTSGAIANGPEDTTLRNVSADVCFSVSTTPLADPAALTVVLGPTFTASGQLIITHTKVTWAKVP